MNRFFVNDRGPDWAVIEGEDLKHLVSVLRLRKGDHVMLSDGRGSECEGEIEHLEPGKARVKTGPWRPCLSEPHHKLTLFQCLPKAGKMETIIQKGTELGMNALVPTLSARCVVQPGRDFDKKLQRYRKVAREAAMQSHRGLIPEVLPLVELKKADLSIFDTVYVAYEGEKERTLKAVMADKPGRRIALFIGPEGGFEAEEVAALVDKGARAVSLGPRILRTETAGMAMCAEILFELGE